MRTEITLRLGSNDVGQILDGLRSRQASWANTATYLRDGYFGDDSFACEECSDSDEAQKLADWYQRVIASVEEQVGAQSGF